MLHIWDSKGQQWEQRKKIITLVFPTIEIPAGDPLDRCYGWFTVHLRCVCVCVCACVCVRVCACVCVCEHWMIWCGDTKRYPPSVTTPWCRTKVRVQTTKCGSWLMGRELLADGRHGAIQSHCSFKLIPHTPPLIHWTVLYSVRLHAFHCASLDTQPHYTVTCPELYYTVTFTLLYYTVSYTIILYYSTLFVTVLYCPVHCTILLHTLYYTILFYTVAYTQLHCTVTLNCPILYANCTLQFHKFNCSKIPHYNTIQSRIYFTIT